MSNILEYKGYHSKIVFDAETFSIRGRIEGIDDYVDFEGKKKCEGPSAFQIAGEEGWRVAYIEYSSRPRHYRICHADANLRNFSDPQDIIGVRAPQHGSFLRLTKKEYKALEKWANKQKK